MHNICLYSYQWANWYPWCLQFAVQGSILRADHDINIAKTSLNSIIWPFVISNLNYAVNWTATCLCECPHLCPHLCMYKILLYPSLILSLIHQISHTFFLPKLFLSEFNCCFLIGKWYFWYAETEKKFKEWCKNWKETVC